MMEIIIDASEFSLQTKESIQRVLKQVIEERLSNGLDLNTLEKIVVPEDFGQAILEFQKKHGKRVTGHTNDEFGLAIGKTMTYNAKGEKRRVIFMDKCLINCLFTDEYILTALHNIHHELCHVHDDFHKSLMFTEESRLGSQTDLTHILRVHSEIIWSEYVAHRLSVMTIGDKTAIYSDYLLELIAKMKPIDDKLIWEYRFHANINLLFNKIQEYSSILLKYACSVLGDFHGLGRTELRESTDTTMMDSTFKDCWFGLDLELNELFNQYPNWEGIHKLDNLGTTVLMCWNWFGVYPEMRNDGTLYIHVPFK